MPKQSRPDLTARIRPQLERALAAVSSRENLQPFSGFGESVMLRTVATEILDELGLIATRKNVAFATADHQMFQWGTSVYEIRVGFAPQAGRCLEVVIAPIRQYEPTLLGPNHHIDAFGRVKEFRVFLPTMFEAQREWIELTVKTIFDIGYRLLNSALQDGVETTQQAPAHALYGHVRSVLPPELAANIKLNAIVETDGIYLFDREAFTASLRTAETTNSLTSKSPLDVLVNVCTTVVPFEQMFSKEALASGKVIEANLFQAKYRFNGNGTHISEMAVYGSQHASVQPLVKSNNTCLVAAYPAAFRRKIEPLLEAESQKFEDIIAQHSKGLRATLNRITEQTKQPITRFLETGAGMLGAFTGVGAAEFIRHMR